MLSSHFFVIATSIQDFDDCSDLVKSDDNLYFLYTNLNNNFYKGKLLDKRL